MKKPTPFGKYYLLERINVGGMAEVFRSKAFGVEGFERLVAVKRILPNIAEDKEFIRMFIEEAKLSVQLNHANIAQIFDLGVVDGSYYIALEHVHGRDLRGIFDRCRSVGEPMPVAQACFVVMKVCEGLDYAHNKRDQSGRELSLVHRDVSPQNVLVSFEGEVKLIDFGIAKAAGKGSKTQAGILKGKFGYMSPEQVRGLPVDRRSDVFSCGIVLYELLTGERLFVGESDFSTLEKVRNVEILPPSTYNRRIPDELERIVLKALAKDVDERYQNAIDLHDELQAFVYTAGEFYSRKDLAGWMKKTFGKEIEEETAKLESYRQLRPPPSEPPAVARAASSSRPPLHTPPPRRASVGNVAGTRPPPPPTRTSQQMPTVPAPKAKRGGDDDDLAWDDDELETQIYDNPEDDPKNQDPNVRRTSKPLPLQPPPPPTVPPPVIAAKPAGDAAGAAPGPDLSKLVGSTVMGWEAGPSGIAAPPPPAPMPSPASTLNGLGGLVPTNGFAPKLANGSNGAASAHEPAVLGPAAAPIPSLAPPPLLFEPAPTTSTGPIDPMSSFGQGIIPRKRAGGSRVLWIIAGAVVVAAVTVTAVILLGGDQPAATERPVAVADEHTGFDLYVTPAGLTQWKLDGTSRTDRLPSSIRGIAPGVHSVAIDPPPGFMGQSQQVTVEAGKAARVEVELKPIPGLTGVFESTPPGATVSLIIDGQRQPPLGEAPQRAPIDPRKSYKVLFEKDGYVSVNRPIVFTGALEEKLVVPLEKAAGPTVAEDTPKPQPKPEQPRPDSRPREVVRTEPRPRPRPTPVPDRRPDPKPDVRIVDDPRPPPDPKPDVKPDPPKRGKGVLSLGSKPPCQIYVDGVATGLHTPQPRLALPAGKHRITLINNEFGINEKFSVEIKADATEKVLKDYSDRLPK